MISTVDITTNFVTKVILFCRIIPALVAGPSNGMPTIAEGEGEKEGDHVPNENERVTFREGEEEGNVERGEVSDMRHDDHGDVQRDPEQMDGKLTVDWR